MSKKDLIKDIYLLLIKAEDDAEEMIEEEAKPVKPKTGLQHSVLDRVQHFGKEMDRILKEEQNIQSFLQGYSRLALLSKSYTNDEIEDLYNTAQQVNVYKELNIPLPEAQIRIDRVIFIDSIAHHLHQFKEPNGAAVYKQLDKLADISKSAGEKERDDRLLILDNPMNIKKLAKMNNLDIIQKGAMLDRGGSFWRLFEKGLREGVESMSDTELIVLREWLYSKV
jgi:hypothetical protein